MHPHPFYAPDGMGMAGRSAQQDSTDLTSSTQDPVLRQLLDVVLPHDRHDDGLVHNHGWAVSSDAPTSGQGMDRYLPALTAPRIEVPASVNATMAAPIRDTIATHPVSDGYDDGLVHNHHWAINTL